VPAGDQETDTRLGLESSLVQTYQSSGYTSTGSMANRRGDKLWSTAFNS
jgi:hypothetical protein